MTFVSEAVAWLRQAFVGMGTNAAVEAAVRRLGRHEVSYDFDTTDTNATANSTGLYLYAAPRNMKVLEAQYVPDAALTLNATNYASATLQLGDGAGTTPTDIATANTSATNMAAGVPFSLTVNTSNEDVDDGEVLCFAVKKHGAGGSLFPKGRLTVSLEER